MEHLRENEELKNHRYFSHLTFLTCHYRNLIMSNILQGCQKWVSLVIQANSSYFLASEITTIVEQNCKLK